MSKVTIAREVAEQFGTTFDDAMRFVDDVGEDTASKVVGSGGRLVDDSRRGLPDIPTGPWAKAGTAATLGGGGALLWKREERKQDQAQAKEAETFQESLEQILSSGDLPPDVRAQLAESAAKGTGGTPPSGSDSGLDDLLPGAPDLGINDGLQTILFILVVLGVIYVLVDDSNNIALSPETGNGGS